MRTCGFCRYINRIVKYSTCSICNVYIGLIYIQRIRRSSCPTLSLQTTNIQRMLLTAIMVASKVHDDIYYSNKFWGMIGEISPAEMATLELHFLHMLNYECFVQREDYDAFLEAIPKCEHLFSGWDPNSFVSPAKVSDQDNRTSASKSVGDDGQTPSQTVNAWMGTFGAAASTAAASMLDYDQIRADTQGTRRRSLTLKPVAADLRLQLLSRRHLPRCRTAMDGDRDKLR